MTQPRKATLQFRCLVIALTTLVVCIMAFNIVWLTVVIETHEKGAVNNWDFAKLVSHEIKPRQHNCAQRKSLRDIQKCFPARLIRKLSPDCTEIKEWPDVQRCLTGRFYRANPANIQHVHIVGERHSGTKFLTTELQTCFPRKTNFTFHVHRDFVRSKHFFQPIVGHDLSTSVIVVIVRDPVAWIAAMREKPYHSPFHVKAFDGKQPVPLDWKDFVSRPWSMPRLPGWDKRVIDTDDPLCQEYFHRNEVIPCEYNRSSGFIKESIHRGFAPLYEMRRDGTGRPFASILELRTEKIVNFILELPLLTDVAGFMVVRYEDILRNGTDFVLDKIQGILNLPDDAMARCNHVPPQPERLQSRPVADDFAQYIREHIDYGTEHLLGYL